MTNDSSTVEYNYYWLDTATIESDGSTYIDPDYGSNQLKKLNNTVNTRAFFGQFYLSVDQKKSLQEFTKNYTKQGVYGLSLYYGKLGEISSTYMMVFDGKSLF